MRRKIAILLLCVCLLMCNFTVSAAIETNFEYKLGNIITSLQVGNSVEPLLGEAVILMIEYDILGSLEKEGETQAAYSLKASADLALAAAGNGTENAQALAISFCEELLYAKRSIANLLVNPDLTAATALAEDTAYGAKTLPAGTMIPDGWTLETNSNITASTAYSYADGTVTLGNGFILSQIVSGIQGGEHYSVTLNRTNSTSYGCTLQVEYLSYDETTGTYQPVSTYAGQVTVGSGYAGTKSVGNHTSIYKLCYYGDNDMQFTAPVNCDAVKVKVSPYKSGSNAKNANFTGVALTATDEVITNGALTKHSSNNLAQNLNGWICSTGTTTKSPVGAFRASGNYVIEQGIQLKANSYYKLSFDFAQSNAAGSEPMIAFTPVANTGSNPVSVVFSDYTTVNSASSSVTAANWKKYEVIFTTTGTSALTNYWLTLKGNGNTYRWYDNISIIEIEDATRVLPVYKSGETMSYASDDAAANGIRYHYVQDAEEKTQMLIRATYDGETLSEVTVLKPGEGLAAGQAGNYDAAYDNTLTTKIYLWDAADLTPVWNTPIVNVQ